MARLPRRAREEAVTLLSEFDLVCAGETFEDLIFHDLPGWPQLGNELQTANLTRTWGGGALLTAVAAARLAIRTQLVTALPAGAETRLRAEKVELRDLPGADEPHAVTVALSNRDDRAFVTYTGSNPQLEARVRDALPLLRAPHVHLALEPHDCLAWVKVLESLCAQRVSTSFDFGCHPALSAREGFAELCAAPDYLLLNARESELYSDALEGARCLVTKLGAEGCEARRGPERWRAPGVRVAAVETTVGARPTSVLVTPDASAVLVLSSGSDCVSVIDSHRLNETSRIPVGRNPMKMALSADARTA